MYLEKNEQIIEKSSFTRDGENFVFYLIKESRQIEVSLKEIMNYKPKPDDVSRIIEAYFYYSNSPRSMKRFIFMLACYYIFKKNDNKEEKTIALQEMFCIFNVESVSEFTAGVTEFKNLASDNLELKHISDYTKKIYKYKELFTDIVIFQILSFAKYNSFNFEIDIDKDTINEFMSKTI